MYLFSRLTHKHNFYHNFHNHANPKWTRSIRQALILVMALMVLGLAGLVPSNAAHAAERGGPDVVPDVILPPCRVAPCASPCGPIFYPQIYPPIKPDYSFCCHLLCRGQCDSITIGDDWPIFCVAQVP